MNQKNNNTYFIFQDWVDGEFSVAKTALHRYMIRSDVNSPDYLEVKDSSTLKQFGEKYLSTPGCKAQLRSRLFVDLLPEEVLARKGEISDTRTIDGISTKFQYICKVNILILLLKY